MRIPTTREYAERAAMRRQSIDIKDAQSAFKQHALNNK
jgi:hypothetical protein